MSEQKRPIRLYDKSVIIGILIFILAVFVAHHYRVENANATVVSTQEQGQNEDRPIMTLRDLNMAYVDLAKAIRPAVVTVSTDRVMTVQSMPFGSDPFLDFFFDQRQGRQNPEQQQFHQRGLGSGVILSKDGIILTNNHVVDGADSIYVRTYDGHKYKADIVGVDAQTDIAVLRIKAKNLPFIPVGNSDDLNVGEIVLAVGSPMSENLAFTVTQGIVSAKGRANVGLADYEDFIQTDAAINPGNSGGPLVNLDGQLVGINTAIVSQSGGFQGIGFAVPSNMAIQVMNSLVKEGRIVRGWLGVSIQDINDNLASAMGLNTTAGALVGDVLKDGPAEKAGLQAGDIITSVNGHDIKSAAELRSQIASTPPGTKVQLGLLRNGNQQTVSVVLAEMPKQIAGMTSPGQMNEMLGFSVGNLTSDLASHLGLDQNQSGVVVTSVDQASSAYQAGLRDGDLIIELNKHNVGNLNDFNNEAKDLKNGDTILLRIIRNDASFFLAFQI